MSQNGGDGGQPHINTALPCTVSADAIDLRFLAFHIDDVAELNSSADRTDYFLCHLFLVVGTDDARDDQDVVVGFDFEPTKWVQVGVTQSFLRCLDTPCGFACNGRKSLTGPGHPWPLFEMRLLCEAKVPSLLVRIDILRYANAAEARVFFKRVSEIKSSWQLQSNGPA